jgi:hypothetical protein
MSELLVKIVPPAQAVVGSIQNSVSNIVEGYELIEVEFEGQACLSHLKINGCFST